VQVFDHSTEGQLLYFKERFLAPNHPQSAVMESFSGKLRKLGLSDKNMMGPTKVEFTKLLEQAGLNEKLNRRHGVAGKDNFREQVFEVTQCGKTR